ncbi:MAG: hypothetical protein FJ161_04800, partial [Gammaproteobacteria bacterium]|nr:hypothetical protein [Gammaproteobacteria bacterium]
MSSQRIIAKLRSPKNQPSIWSVTVHTSLEYPVSIVDCVRFFDALSLQIINDPVCDVGDSKVFDTDKVLQFQLQSKFILPENVSTSDILSVVENLLNRVLIKKEPYDKYDILTFALG